MKLPSLTGVRRVWPLDWDAIFAFPLNRKGVILDEERVVVQGEVQLGQVFVRLLGATDKRPVSLLSFLLGHSPSDLNPDYELLISDNVPSGSIKMVDD